MEVKESLHLHPPILQQTMQLLAPALLLTAVVAARGASLRGDFERDVANPSGRRLDHHCVDNASYLGCFDDQNNKRAMPYQVRGQGHSARECMRACDKKGYSTFARQWKGQCFCGDGDDHERHGKERGCDCCDDNVGGGKSEWPWSPRRGRLRQLGGAAVIGVAAAEGAW